MTCRTLIRFDRLFQTLSIPTSKPDATVKSIIGERTVYRQRPLEKLYRTCENWNLLRIQMKRWKNVYMEIPTLQKTKFRMHFNTSLQCTTSHCRAFFISKHTHTYIICRCVAFEPCARVKLFSPIEIERKKNDRNLSKNRNISRRISRNHR